MALPDDDLPIHEDILSLHGVTLPATEDDSATPVVESEEADGPPTLTLKPWDEVPGRDFQPRLLRFGEAA
jgi:hypothetical protein